MRHFKKIMLRIGTYFLVVMMISVLIATGLPGKSVEAQLPALDPNLVRDAARQMGMDSLASVILTDPPALLLYFRGTPPTATGDPLTNPPTLAPPAALVNYAAANGISVQRAALRVLGKALFWDQQAGSDGQACATCHFLAGGDNRVTNTLNPGSRNTNAAESVLWNPTLSGGTGAPNYTLTAGDFPFHKLTDPLETNYEKKDVIFDTDDIVGSIGTFHATFTGSPAPNYNTAFAQGTYDSFTPIVDPVFKVGTRNTRSNGPRQAAPMINAVFNFRNFWDARADNTFNGFNPFGAMDQVTMLKVNTGTALTQDFAAVTNSSLASQACGPPVAATSDEMAFTGRTMPDLGRKMLRLTGPGKGATATATLGFGVLTITVTAGGTGYTAPVVSFSGGGGGTGAAGTATVDATGAITGITVDLPGSGYTAAPTVNITDATGTGAAATATLDTAGSVKTITITAPGSNYIHGATVSISGGGGGGATATATVNGAGAVTGITITAAGSAFVTPPLVLISSTGLGYNAIIPLGAQLISSTDSVLGSFSPAAANGGRGISLKYANLIQWAFVPQYWDSSGPPDPVSGLNTTLLTTDGFHLMESNFGLFWGLAIQEYETTLRADQSPYDQFMAGNNSAFDPIGGPTSQKSQDIMRGLLTYIHTENTAQQVNPIFNNINFGACQLCHSGPELTENSLTNVPLKFFVTTDMTVKMDHNRDLAIVPASSNFDVGFTNIGSRPSREDLGLGATVLNGLPLSQTRAGLQGFIFGLPALFPAKPNPSRGSNIDGAFKIPSLRNIELTGPYFHHGGELTLKQTVEFYARHGDFADVNEPNIDVGLAMVNNIADADADLLVKLLISMTDERVRWEQAPFDHPQLFIPNGNNTGLNNPVLGAGYAADNYITLPAVGAAGRSTLPAGPYPAGNSPLPNFLNISSVPVAGPNNDQFDP
jgi:cytochrome c peroxidase